MPDKKQTSKPKAKHCNRLFALLITSYATQECSREFIAGICTVQDFYITNVSGKK